VLQNAATVSLPDWLFDRRRERLAWVVWGVVFLGCGVLSVLRPGVREVVHVYREASRAWLSGRDIYPGIDYPPTFVVLFAPFAKLPVSVCEIVWRALQLTVYLSSLKRLAKVVSLAPPRLFFFISLLSLPAALGSIRSGQTNLMLAGSMAHAASAWIAGRRLSAATWLTVAVVAKPIGIVMVLLLAAVDLAMVPWLVAGLLFSAAFPLLFDPWPYVIHQYKAWFADILAVAASRENRFDDLTGLFRALHWEVPAAWMWIGRVVAAALTLLIWRAASARFAKRRSGLFLLGLSASYLMLFNPRTESNGYVILSHAIASFAALLLVVEGRPAGWLLVGLEAAMTNGIFGRTVFDLTRLWLMPVLAIVFLGFLIFEVWRVPPSGPVLPQGLGMPPPA
jgi:glycosyl transferase family 87